MNSTLFQVINYSLILIVLIIFIRYIWDMIFDRNYQPAEWQHAVKQGSIPKLLQKIERSYPDKVRFFNWWFLVERLKKEQIPGDFAELGVYKGDSAKVIHHMDPTRNFHLFDTFSGFPEDDLKMETGEAATYTKANFSDTTVERVRQTISGNQHIMIHPGYFPGTAHAVIHQRFALVNMDADLYLPTKAGLEFFYQRLSPGGVILVHDYNAKWEGIKKAVDEFVQTIQESLVVLPDMEGTAMIIKSK